MIFVVAGRAHCKKQQDKLQLAMVPQKRARDQTVREARLHAKWRKSFDTLLARSISEMRTLDISAEALHQVLHGTEQIQINPTESEVLQLRQLARERGMASGNSGGQALSLTEITAMTRGEQGDIWSTGAPEATDAWLASQIATQAKNSGDRAGYLELMDSMNRAAEGKILLHPNTKAGPEQKAKTAFLTTIKTRKQFQALLSKVHTEQPAQCLAPKYLKSRTSYVKGYEAMMREGFGAIPWRLCWGTDLTMAQKRREENYLIAWFTLCRIRYKSFGSVEQAVSHVMQFHITHLDLAPPPFPRLYNRLRLARRGAKKSEVRKRRPYIKPEYVMAIASVCSKYVQNKNHDIDDRIAVCALWCIITAGFTLLFRVGELARGAEFNAERHWNVNDMRPLLALKAGEDMCVRQPQRKVPGEHAQEQMPVAYWDNVACFAFAMRTKLALHGEKQPGYVDAFSIDRKHNSPTAEWVSGRLRALMRALFPHAAQGMDYSDHTLRRGGATCLSVMNIDPAIQEQAGGWAPGSSCRPLYIARVREQLAKAQRNMYKQRYTIMQDDIGFSVNSSAKAKQEQPRQISNDMADTAANAAPEKMDVDIEEEDNLMQEALDSEEWAEKFVANPANQPSLESMWNIESEEREETRDPVPPPPEKRAKIQPADSSSAVAKALRPHAKEVNPDPCGLFDLTRSDTLDTKFDSTREVAICVRFQLGGYHSWNDCELCSRGGNICSFCRRGDHGCARCPSGGAVRIDRFNELQASVIGGI